MSDTRIKAPLGETRPGGSPQSAAFLERLREHLRGRLFGSSQVPAGSPPRRGIAAPVRGRVEAPLPKQIGRYEVLGRIGSGGMGVIYSAFDRDLGRKVAIKLLNPSTAAGEQARLRLTREAKALAKLSHPGVVHVYEVGIFAAQVFVAMEFVEGSTLRKWQSRQERSWRQVLRAYIAAGEGLAAGHAAGIVHRDFKPDNVLVGDDGEVRVIDFGLARTASEHAPDSTSIDPSKHADVDTALTKTGTLMGTPAYMAPEQFKGDIADARTDQFAFCVALYEALYGYRPFAGATVHQLATNVLSGLVEPPPRYTDVPERVYRALLRGLEVDPVERYDELEDLLRRLPSEAPKYVQWSIGALGALAIAGGAVAWGYTLLEDSRRETRLEEIRSSYVAARGAEAEARLRSSWGRTRLRRHNDLVLRNAETLTSRDSTHALATLKRLDPKDTRWIAPARLLGAEAEAHAVVMRTVRLGVGPVTHLATNNSGDRLAIGAGPHGVFAYPSAGGSSAFQLPQGAFEVRTMAMARTGDVVVAAEENGSTRVWTDLTAAPRIWPATSGSVTAVAVSDNGDRVALGTTQGIVTLRNLDTATKLSSEEHKGEVLALGFSPDGSMLASAGTDNKLRVAFLEENKRWVIPHRPEAKVVSLSFSHDGNFVDCLGNDGKVWRVRTDERRGVVLETIVGATLLSEASGSSALATYAPGQPLRVYPSAADPPRELDSGAVTALTMSGDGTFVVAAGRDNSVRTWKVLRRDHTYRVGDAVVFALAHDTARGRLAVGGSGGMVRVWDLVGDDWRSSGQLMGGVHELVFSPDGTRLAALGGLGGISIWSLDKAGSEPKSLLPAAFVEPIRWSPDGTRIAVELCDTPRRCGLVVHDLDRDERVLAAPLGLPAKSFLLSPAARSALVVRRGGQHPVELYDLEMDVSVTVPWPQPDHPPHVVAHAFASDASYIRMVSFDDGEARLWHWEPRAELLAVLDTIVANAVVPDVTSRAALLRGVAGDELWVLDEVLRRPIGRMPDKIDYLELSPAGDVVLVVSGTEATLLHQDTGVRRTLLGIDEPFAWRGLSAFAVVAGPNAVQLRHDPTPAEPKAFLNWLGELTDVVPADVSSG